MRIIISNIIVGLLFAVFLTSGIGKLLDPESAVTTLVMAFDLSNDFAKLFVVLVSNVEIALAFSLLLKKYKSVGLKSCFGMLGIFLIYLLYLHFGGIVVSDCGCFGGFIKRTIPEAIIENLILMGLNIIYYFLSSKTAHLFRVDIKNII